ncbi:MULTISPECIES: nucleotidyltransferase family protein [unclassified Streptomyces]|uniref:nucleotidyltransferase family protein n=1 Tax=unclassified Streptomyces TaxID=2593676 RepID=UPI0003C96F3C|nr:MULTISPECIES: nucleotidyltransferase family protein [unclassified Streptomyces]AGZ94433.1 hypothetical protein [Streptomyces sp. NRRL B-16215]
MKRGQREQEDLLAVLSLGSVAPAMDGARARARIDSLPPARAAEWLTRNKVVGRCAPRIPPALREALAPHIARREKLNRYLDERIGVVGRAAEEAGVRCFLIKGMAARTLYERPEDRDTGDIDVWVPTADEACALSASLMGAGFDVDPHELPWLKATPDGLVYGQMLLRVQADAEMSVSVDIHFGGYSVRHCGLLPLDPGNAGPGLHRLDSEQNLPVLIANAAGDFFTPLKDLNDLYLYLDPDIAAVDWDKVRKQLSSAGLESYFDGMLDRVARWYALEPRRRRRMAGLRFGARHEPAPSPFAPQWYHRWGVTTAHAARLGLRQSARAGLRCATTAARYYGRHLRLDVDRSRRAHRHAVRMRESLNPWTCVRLVPVDLASELLPGVSPVGGGTPAYADSTGRSWTLPGASGVRVIELADGDLVTVNDRVYVPTVWYRLPEPLLRSAARYAAT